MQEVSGSIPLGSTNYSNEINILTYSTVSRDQRFSPGTAKTFASAFPDGQRGVVIVKTFNEAPDLPGKPEQHTITPRDRGAIGIAFIWRQFDMAAPQQIGCPPCWRRTDDWAMWLGETGTLADDAKGCFKPVEDLNWTMAKEERATIIRRRKQRPN